MNKKLLTIGGLFLIVLVVVLVFVFRTGTARPQANNEPAANNQPEANSPAEATSPPAQNSAPADPQHLLIPRWFLNAVTLDGQSYPVPPEQQAATIQFLEGGQVNGTGPCNDFGSTYQANPDGSIKFEPPMSTMKLCDEGMDVETAYFQALEKVTRFGFVEGKLTLTSADGKTELIFRMPPK